MIVYSLPDCGRCALIKERLDAKGITYQENQDVKEMKELGFMTVPMVKTDEGELLDFGKAISYINSL